MDGTRTRKPTVSLVPWFIQTIYLAHYPFHLLLTHASFKKNTDLFDAIVASFIIQKNVQFVIELLAAAFNVTFDLK